MTIAHLTSSQQLDRLCSTIPASFSVFFDLLVIISILCFLKLHTQAFYILFLQTCCEFLFNMNRLIFYIPPEDGTILCSFQGWYSGFTTISSTLFTCLISSHMYLIITKRNYSLSNRELAQVSCGIILLAAVLGAIPLSTNQFGNIGLSCAILEDGSNHTSRPIGIAMRYTLYYGIVWGVSLYCIWAYMTIYQYVMKVQQELQGNVTSPNRRPSDIEVTVYRLRYYPGNLII